MKKTCKIMEQDIPQELRFRAQDLELDENERGNITRLMKVKDMVLQEAHEFQQPAG